MKGTSLSTFFLHLLVSTGSVESTPAGHPPSTWYIALSELATLSVFTICSEYFGMLFKSIKFGFLVR